MNILPIIVSFKFFVCYEDDEARITRLDVFDTMSEATDFIIEWNNSPKKKEQQAIDELFVMPVTVVQSAQTEEG